MRQFLEALVELIEPNNCCFVQQTQTHSSNVIDFSNAIERYSIESLLSNENHQAKKRKLQYSTQPKNSHSVTSRGF